MSGALAEAQQGLPEQERVLGSSSFVAAVYERITTPDKTPLLRRCPGRRIAVVRYDMDGGAQQTVVTEVFDDPYPTDYITQDGEVAHGVVLNHRYFLSRFETTAETEYQIHKIRSVRADDGEVLNIESPSSPNQCAAQALNALRDHAAAKRSRASQTYYQLMLDFPRYLKQTP